MFCSGLPLWGLLAASNRILLFLPPETYRVSLDLKIQTFCFKSYSNTLLSGVKNTATSRLKNVNSSDENMKQASKLWPFYRKGKRLPANVNWDTEKISLIMHDHGNWWSSFFHFSGEVPQEIVLNENDQVNIINRCCSEKPVRHSLLGSRLNIKSSSKITLIRSRYFQFLFFLEQGVIFGVLCLK